MITMYYDMLSLYNASNNLFFEEVINNNDKAKISPTPCYTY